MATPVPSPILDTRNGDLVVAEAIGSLPSELSDRSDSNPAVVILEAAGAMFDKLIYQLNQFPPALIQQALALVGINYIAAQAAITQQTFTLSSPQKTDSVIPAGTQASTADGTISFATLSDVTVRAYTPSGVTIGAITLNAGSPYVIGSSTSFTTDTQVGWQISTDANTWYTVASITSNTSLTLTTSAAATVTSSAYSTGAVSATVNAQATVTGSATNVAAGTLTTLTSQPPGVATTSNGAAATGGTNLEISTNAIARAPVAFAARDVALSVADFGYFAQQILGSNGRAIAFANTNVTTSQTGYVTIAMLSPAWTTSLTVSSQERANVIKDLSQRTLVGTSLIDVAANLQRFDQGTAIPSVIFFRKSGFDQTKTQLLIAGAINTLFSPNTYPWGRTVYTADMAKAVEAVAGVDRILSINGVPAIACNSLTTTGAITFTATSQTVSAVGADIGAGLIQAGLTYLVDPTNQAGYLVTAISGTTLTISPVYAGATNTVASGLPYFNVGDTPLTNAYTLPYANLSTTTASTTIVCTGVV